VPDFPAHYRGLASDADATPNMVDATLRECTTFSEDMPVFGGHGYIPEHSMEQTLRDARISNQY
jgi:hypothetical protein